MTREECLARDRADPLAGLAARFAPGAEGTLYFDANSVGAMPIAAPAAMAAMLDEWRHLRRRGWSESDWLAAPRRLGDKLAPVIGAALGQVVVGDTTSVNLFKALAAALAMRPDRRKVVGEAATFPTDLYVAERLIAGLGGRELVLAPDGADPAALIDGDTAVLYLSHVDYRTARMHDLKALTARAQAAGALVIWDLSHSTGAVAIGLDAANADFAVGCGYKYLCGGPGAPAYIYAAHRHHDAIRPLLAGWMGHARTFDFPLAYEPAPGIGRFQVGTPAVLAHAVMETALDLWAGIDPHAAFAKHAALGDLIVTLANGIDGIGLASPSDARERGGFVALRHPNAASIVAALGAAGVVASHRPPDSIRFGLSPLYHRHVEVFDAIERLGRIMRDGAWRDPQFAKGSKI